MAFDSKGIVRVAGNRLECCLLVVYPDKGVRGEVLVVRRVVFCLRDDYRVLDDLKTPGFVGVDANAAFNASMLYAGAGAMFATRICIIVLVFGPNPGCVFGAPPVSVWSPFPVK